MSKARDLANAGTALGAVTATELGYVDGVTSAIQTQLNAKQAVVSGGNDTELGYLDGVTSAIQTQLDAKTAKSTLTTTGDIYYASAANTPARLGIGSSAQVLTVASGIPSWATPAAGGGMTLISTTSVSGTTTTISSIPNTYKALFLVIQDVYSSNAYTNLKIRFNSSVNDYRYMGIAINPSTGAARRTSDSYDAVTDSIHFDATVGTSTFFSNRFRCVASIWNYNTTDAKILAIQSSATNGDGENPRTLTGAWHDSATVSSISLVSSHSLSAGTIKLYGVN